MRSASFMPLLLVAACSAHNDRVPAVDRKHEPKPPVTAPQPVPTTDEVASGSVYVTGPNGEVKVAVEVVDTEAAIQQGLMYRRFLGPDSGMLFVPRVEQVWRFWMRNTLIPLDIIFIARDLTIAGVAENAIPHDETNLSVDKESLYILEVNAGWCKQHGVGAGNRVRFADIAAVAE